MKSIDMGFEYDLGERVPLGSDNSTPRRAISQYIREFRSFPPARLRAT
jgi:hypothetical protein